MSEQFDIEVKGAKELKAAVRRMPAAMRREARGRFKRIGQILTTVAQAIARSKRLVLSGDLVKGIKPTASEMKVVVNAGAKDTSAHRKRAAAARRPAGGKGRKRKGSGVKANAYNYPKLYEYGGATHRKGKMSGGPNSLSPVVHRSRAATKRGLGPGASPTTGSRAFMAPALSVKKNEIVREFTKVLDEMAREFGR